MSKHLDIVDSDNQSSSIETDHIVQRLSNLIQSQDKLHSNSNHALAQEKKAKKIECNEEIHQTSAKLDVIFGNKKAKDDHKSIKGSQIKSAPFIQKETLTCDEDIDQITNDLKAIFNKSAKGVQEIHAQDSGRNAPTNPMHSISEEVNRIFKQLDSLSENKSADYPENDSLRDSVVSRVKSNAQAQGLHHELDSIDSRTVPVTKNKDFKHNKSKAVHNSLDLSNQHRVVSHEVNQLMMKLKAIN